MNTEDTEINNKNKEARLKYFRDQKRKKIATETAEEQEMRLARDREQKREKRKARTAEEQEMHIEHEHNQKQKKVDMETTTEREERLARDRNRKKEKRAAETVEERELRLEHRRNNWKKKRTTETTNKYNEHNCEYLSSETDEYMEIEENLKIDQFQLAESDKKLLNTFRKKMTTLKNELCPTCDERFPSIILYQGECHRCYMEKNTPKKFSAKNNMNPGDVPQELQGLTNIEEMLIAQVFPIVSVYNLRGGQYAYRGNVINFSQDIQGFVTQLPHHPSSLNTLIIRRPSFNGSTFQDFQVRREKVYQALCWLKANNIFYRDIDIAEDILLLLPENGSIIEQLQQISDDQSNNEKELCESNDIHKENIISHTFIPIPPPKCREDSAIYKALNNLQNNYQPPIIEWPKIERTPIDEFNTPGYIVRAFPTLYPQGIADLYAPRIKKVQPAEYFQHLLKYKDGRFAQHPRWRYFALNSQMRWRALQSGRVFVQQNLEEGQLTAIEVQDLLQSNNTLANRVIHYGEILRGTRQYWARRSCELSDMICQLGSKGMIFFTFSSADFHWPELHDLMPHGENLTEGITSEEAAKYRYQDLINNPHIAAWFFNKRFNVFFEKVLIPKWKLVDWWFRFEWQHRGSAHIHGIGIRADGPIFEWNKIKDNERLIQNVLHYMDSLITTINPDINAPIPNNHPCQKRMELCNDDLQDYVELVNKLQRHTRCSTLHCLKVNKQTGQQVCRFGFPKELREKTIIQDNSRGQPELLTARNDPYINPHDRLQLQGWRANVDLKPILTTYAALQYVSKYASKSEPRSASFSDILDRILRHGKPNEPSVKSFQKLLLHTVSERDFSAQETCHLLLGIPLYHCSRNFVTLNLNKETLRLIHNSNKNHDNGDNSHDTVKTGFSSLQLYWTRPPELQDLTLFQLYLNYKYVGKKWKHCTKNNIVRIFPRPSPLRNGPCWEEFCRIKVLLHVCHRDILQLTENRTLSWPELYDRYLQEIEDGPSDILGLATDNPEEKDINQNEYQTEEESEEESEEDSRPDWMNFAETGPNIHTYESLELGSRSIDINYNWAKESKDRYPTLADPSTFVQRASRESASDNEINDFIYDIDCESLNENQKIILERLECNYIAKIAGKKVKPLRIIIMGTAGTGKSHLIKAIRYKFDKIRRKYNLSQPILVLAPTGVAAFNIRGSTIHSALLIPVNAKSFDLTGERLKQLQNKLQWVSYFIIDEMSMVGRRTLALIDLRLRQAFPDCQDLPFGGRSVIFVGDFGQLPPVCDLPMYAQDSRPSDALSEDGRTVYSQFREVYKLNIVQRQTGNSEEQSQFRSLLIRLRDGKSTISDWEMLMRRLPEKLTIQEREIFSNAIYVLPKWDAVDKVNLEKLQSLNQPVARICAVHSDNHEALKADSDVAKGLEAELLLARGAHVMLTTNLWTSAGLVNGAMGRIIDIIYDEGHSPTSLPNSVLVAFDDYHGPTITTPEGVQVVPIAPIRRTWDGKFGTCSRLQIPLILAWAITVHKSQGLTLPKAVINIGEREFAAGLSFVAISRVRSISDIIFEHFTFERLQRIKKCTRVQERILEEKRLIDISTMFN